MMFMDVFCSFFLLLSLSSASYGDTSHPSWPVTAMQDGDVPLQSQVQRIRGELPSQ